MRTRRLVLGLVAAGALIAAPAARADTQAVTGTTLGNSISVGTITAATFGTTLGSSGTVTDTGLGAVPITAIGPWTMSATGGGASGHEGHLALAASQPLCSTSTSPLTNALQAYPEATLPTDFSATVTSGSPATLGASPAQLATGSGSNVVTVRYKQAASGSDQLTAGCIYTETTTLTIS